MPPVTKPDAFHSPSLDDRDAVTAEDLAQYRLPASLPPSSPHIIVPEYVTFSRAASAPPPSSSYTPSPTLARSVTERQATPELDNDESMDEGAEEGGVSSFVPDDPSTQAASSPFVDMLRRHGVTSGPSEVPINVAFRRRIRAKKCPYYTRITVAEAPLAQVDEAAGPINSSSTDADHMSSYLGNLRVHIHLLGVQIWYLDVAPTTSLPVWQPVTSPGKDTKHPDTVNLPTHRLSIQNGAGVPSWVTTKTLSTYHSRFAPGHL